MISGFLGKKSKFIKSACFLWKFIVGGQVVIDVFVNVDSMCRQCLSRYHVDKLSMIKFTLLWSCGYKIVLAG